MQRNDLQLHLTAKAPLLWVVTHEEHRVSDILNAQPDVATAIGWSATAGTYPVKGKNRRFETGPGIPALQAMLVTIPADPKQPGPNVLLLKDLHRYLADPLMARSLRDVAEVARQRGMVIVITAPTAEGIPEEIKKITTVVDLPLPTATEHAELFNFGPGELEAAFPGANIELLSRALCGLTTRQAESAIAVALSSDNLTPACLSGQKRQIVRESGALTFLDSDVSLDSIGGLEVLKQWALDRTAHFTDEARDFGIDLPKGMLTVGPPGCGKSLTAKALGSAWSFPVLQLDVGAMFGSLVGSSEERMRQVIATAEAVAPCILYIDEIEKGLGSGGGGGDGGTGSRVFGTFLNWMQEKTAPVFVVATANRVRSLPPELTRRGRFDETFYVGLPGAKAVAAILNIHLASRGHGLVVSELDGYCQDISDSYSGAELEAGVKDAIAEAFKTKRRIVTDAHLEHALKSVTPLSQSRADEFKVIEQWGEKNARQASE